MSSRHWPRAPRPSTQPCTGLDALRTATHERPKESSACRRWLANALRYRRWRTDRPRARRTFRARSFRSGVGAMNREISLPPKRTLTQSLRVRLKVVTPIYGGAAKPRTIDEIDVI